MATEQVSRHVFIKVPSRDISFAKERRICFWKQGSKRLTEHLAMISKDKAEDGADVDMTLDLVLDSAILSIYLKFDSMKV